ncbi:MAG: M23 family metallopeptidase [Vampirovibrionales bacterium]
MWGSQSFWAYAVPAVHKTPRWQALLAVDPLSPVGSRTLKVLDASNKVLASTSLTVVATSFQTQAIRVSKQTAGLSPQAGEMEAIGALKALKTAKRYWDLPLRFNAPVPQCMNSPFGVKRVVNGVFTGNIHKGIDQKSPQGQIIKAPESGKVQLARAFRLHGGTVGLDHGQGLTSIYIHMSQILVNEGDIVVKGQAIGKVGSTGFAAGPHLHWGAFVQGVSVDPLHLTPFVTACQ